MRITESNMTPASQWAHLRPDEPSAPARDAAAQTAAVAAASRLDTDRDGWLDEDDIPYDQLERLARKAEDNAELGVIHLGAAAATPLASEVTPRAPEVAPARSAADPTPAAQAEPDPEPHGVAPHIDLFA